MKHVLLVLSLSGLALCGSLSNEYLPPGTGISSNSISGPISRPFGHAGGAISSYSPSGSAFGGSAPSSQYGAPALNRQFGNQYASSSQYRTAAPSSLYGAPTQYSRPQAPASVYGGPSQYSTQYNRPQAPASVYGTPSQYSTQYNRPQAPAPVYGAPSQYSTSGSLFRAQTLPSTQYGAPSFGTQHGIGAGSQYSSPFGQPSRISTQYGAPQQYQPTAQYSQPGASFRAGPQFGGLSSVHGGAGSSVYRPTTAYSGTGTVQDSNGGYVY